MVKAQRELTCTSKAMEQERQSLGVRWFPEGRARTQAEMQNLQRYVTGAGTRGEERLFRYLTLLAGFAYQANYSNDQFLRSRFDGLILGHAAPSLNYAAPNLMTQIFLCAQARLMSAMIETGQPAYVNQLGATLAGHYAKLPITPPVNDWPLITALRHVVVSPEGHERALNDLTAATLNRALALEQRAPMRASFLFAEAAAGRYRTGDAREAFAIGARSVMVMPDPYKAAAAWRAYPAMFDAAVITGRSEPPTATQLTESFFTNYDFPEDTGDSELDFAVNMRMAEAMREMGMDNTNFWVLAYNHLRKLNHGVVSHEFLRRGLQRLADATDKPVDMLLSARTMDALPASELVKAKMLYDQVLSGRRETVQIDTGEQLLLSFMTESILYSLSRIQPRNAREQAEILDLSFRALQLDSFTRISVAAASTGIRNLKMDKDRRFALERFYTYTADHSAWLDVTGLRVAVAPSQKIPSAKEMWVSFMTISVFQNETGAELEKYYAILKQFSPETFAMTVPYAIPMRDFQAKLAANDAVFASVVGTTESYVWGVRNNQVAFTRIDASAADISASVTALRASLAASGSGNQLTVPPFEAGVAHTLYEQTIGSVRDSLVGADNLYWYGDGALGALPPAILVTARPKAGQLSSLSDLNATAFLVDDYALSSLPDLFLGKTEFLRSGRKTAASAKFAGFGAPLLSEQELEQDSLSSSFELAGGVPVGDLRSLAKLPAAKNELDSLSEVFDEPEIWLGEEASEANLRAAPLDQYRVIAFATHGFTRSDIQGQIYPSLLMAPPENPTSIANDGLLTTLEIGRLELNADLVLLSACNTATSDGRPDAEAFSGLAQAFLVAGAQSLLVSHWPVASGAASELSVGAVANWQAGDSLARSLQSSVTTLRANASSDIEAHPFFWGPFVIASDGEPNRAR